ncbi:DUF4339 domain-containing protein [Shewanella sedimentimangrovi]|uniref:DUF4339 domain-containing protein n=1 Tax=Shewanella sedimentimangrovi TaxID=2814293 RepID=A0ABX7R201_9GAMM|nr:GYF domain-containing protein [Shewanella sedimentimangrovi]QSX37803.1 DUF4339 domain-containing protein [Shewanella sedimentimangrovi]
MKKWFFSHDGEVSGPFTQAEALAYVPGNPNSYGWHPSLSQWLPVSHIGEFAALVTPPESPAQIPQALIDDFTDKRQALTEKVVEMDEAIKFSKTYLYELEQEINIYKRLTHKMSDEVRSNISSIEDKYHGYQKVLEELIQAMAEAKTELADVIAEFEHRLEARAKDQAFVPAPPQVTLELAPVPSTAAMPEALMPDAIQETEIPEALDPVPVAKAPPVATPVATAVASTMAPLEPELTSLVSADPVAAKPQVVDPVAAKPAARDTLVTEAMDPVAAKPADPVAAKPRSLDPVAAKPTSWNPAPLAPISLDPVASRSGSLDPVATKGGMLDKLAVASSANVSLDPQPIKPSRSASKATPRVDMEELVADLVPKKSQQKIDNTQFSADEDQDKAAAKSEAPAKLQAVTSILKSVFKKTEADSQHDAKSPVSLAHSNDELDDHDELYELDEHEDHDEHDDDQLEAGTGTGGKREITADSAGRMRRRSRRRR